MKFLPLRIEDQDQYNKLLKNNLSLFNQNEGSELCFANLYAWKDDDKIEIHHDNDYLIVKGLYKGKVYFLPPLVNSIASFDKAISDLHAYCDENNIYMIIYETSQAVKDFMIKYHEDYGLISYENRDLSEYVYKVSDLLTLPGKKYHAKRNFVSRFMNQYSYTYREYSSNDYDELIDNLQKWDIKRNNNNEINAIKNVLLHLDNLNAYCDILVINNHIEGFTIFAKSYANCDIVYTLFEKGNTEYEGIFPTINYLCANKNYQNYTFCNRQEDMGILNLRKSKLSYHPDHLATKSTLVSMKLISDLKHLYMQAFNDSIEYTNYFFNNINYHQIEYLESSSNEKRVILSALYLINKELSFFDAILSCPLIVGLSTNIDYQHQGYCSLLMKNTLMNLHNQNIPLVYLYPEPVEHSFYNKYGFGLMNYIFDYKDISLMESNSEPKIEGISNFYSKESTTRLVYIIRNDSDYEALNDKISLYHGKIEYCYNNTNEITGYQITSFNDDNSINLEESLYHNIVPTCLGMMVRILDLRTILQNYKFDEKLNLSVKIKINDTIIDKNNMIINLTLSNGIQTITNCDLYDYEFDISEITKIIFTGSNDLLLGKLFKNLNVLNNDKY